MQVSLAEKDLELHALAEKDYACAVCKVHLCEERHEVGWDHENNCAWEACLSVYVS